MKNTLLILFLAIFTSIAYGQVSYPESENINNIPNGILYQAGPGTNNSTLNWTYPYATKLTINESAYRNFEILTTSYPSGDLMFRQWDVTGNVWSPWRQIIMADINGNTNLNGTFVTTNPNNVNASVHMSWLNDVARIRVGGSGTGATAGLDIQTTGDRSIMRLLHNGRVGIGTVNPDELLAVNGTIHAREVRVDLNGWPDYVFDPNYNLTPINELETYLKKNRHLPGIPSATKVEEEGIELGQMNKALLEKVEELTLYIIDLKKENESIKEKLEVISSQLEK